MAESTQPIPKQDINTRDYKKCITKTSSESNDKCRPITGAGTGVTQMNSLTTDTAKLQILYIKL